MKDFKKFMFDENASVAYVSGFVKKRGGRKVMRC